MLISDFINNYTKIFADASGTIEYLSTDSDIQQAQTSVVAEAELNKVDFLNPVPATDPTEIEQRLGYRLTWGALDLNLKQQNDNSTSPVSVMVAKNQSGNIVGSAMIQNVDANVVIHYQGSIYTKQGIGCSLLAETFKQAATHNLGVALKSEQLASGFWGKVGFTQMGFDGDFPTYSIDNKTVTQILQGIL